MATGMKRKILFVQTQAENGGAQEISRILGEKLAQRGHEVHHLFFYRKSETFVDLPNQEIICETRPNTPGTFISFLLSLRRAIKTLNPNAVFTFQHYGNVFGAPAAKAAGIENIIANQVSARELINPILRKADAWLGRTNIYNRITVNSHDLMRDYQGLSETYTSKLLHVPHGFEPKTSDLSKKAARKVFGLPENVTLLGTVARLNETKQIDRAIALLELERDWHFAIAGQGPDEGRLRTLIEDRGYVNRCHFLGEKNASEVADFLKSIDVFLFPTRAETFGLAGVEAANAGVPVVANKLPILQEILAFNGKPAALFVDVEDPEVFHNATRSVLSDKTLRSSLVEIGSQLEDLYSLDAMTDVYEALAHDPLAQFEQRA